MRYALYTDKTGHGDGDFVNDFPTLEEARAAGEALWNYYTGYNVYEEKDAESGTGKLVASRAPTQPDEPEAMTAMDMFEAGRF